MTFVNLASAISIDSQGIEVYGDEYATSKPDMGLKLNVPAILTQKGVKKPSKKTMVQFTDKLVNVSEAADAEHISYDEGRAEWTFKVKHFTKYGLVDSDSDEEEQPVKQMEAKP